jgi:hypothetical protein
MDVPLIPANSEAVKDACAVVKQISIFDSRQLATHGSGNMTVQCQSMDVRGARLCVLPFVGRVGSQ